MVQILVDQSKSLPAQMWLVPDLVWTDEIDTGRFGFGDFEMASDDETFNQTGLAARRPLETAIILCLMCDARRPDDVEDYSGGGDRRGWFGDVIDVDAGAGERAIGSLLWTLERAPITDQTGIMAVAYASDALQTIVDQGLVEYFEITYSLDPANDFLGLNIKAHPTDTSSPLITSIPVIANV